MVLDLSHATTFFNHIENEFIVITRARFVKCGYSSLPKEGYARWIWQTIRQKPDRRAMRRK
jgi:hypothetical protein